LEEANCLGFPGRQAWKSMTDRVGYKGQLLAYLIHVFVGNIKEQIIELEQSCSINSNKQKEKMVRWDVTGARHVQPFFFANDQDIFLFDGADDVST
jgi:hypothetical protein